MNTMDKLSQKTTATWWWKLDFLSPKKFPLMSRNARNNENGRFTKIHQSEWTFMDLTILANFSQFRQSGNQLGGFDDFDEYSPFSLLHAFLDISHLWSLLKMFVLGKKEPTEDENKGDKGQSGNWSWTNTLPSSRRKLVVP